MFYFLFLILSIEAYSMTNGLDYNIEYSTPPKNNFSYHIQELKQNEVIETIVQKEPQWVRYKDVMSTPRVELKVISRHKEQLSIRYNKHIFLLQSAGKSKKTSIHIYPFINDSFSIYSKDKLIYKGKLLVRNNKSKVVIDHSCSFAQLKVSNEDVPLIIGCSKKDKGDFFEQKKDVSLVISTANFKVSSHNDGPYTVPIDKEAIIQLELLNSNEQKKKLVIESSYSPRAHRLSLALGFGPYQFDSQFQFKKQKPSIAPAIMLYGNFKLTKDTSIRAFDALVTKKSFFNNAGIYLANDIARFQDRKLSFTTLLGVQYLNFKFDKGFKTFSEPIYPQGLEFTYKHFLDIRNYVMSGGLFISPTSETDYQNMWVRWGKSYYWELNYIKWAQDDYRVSMWGLSLIFPLGQFY